MIIFGWLLSVIGALGTTICAFVNADIQPDVLRSYSTYHKDIESKETIDAIFFVFVLILLLGVGLLIAGYIRDNSIRAKQTAINQSRQQQLNNSVLCLHCKSVVSSDNRYCARCGEDLSVQILNAVQSCPFCGALGEGKNPHCSKCGKQIPK